MEEPSCFATGALVDKFMLDTWEDVDLTGKVMQIQCGKCWKMVRKFFMRRRKTPMGSIVHDAECHRCHMIKPDDQKGVVHSLALIMILTAVCGLLGACARKDRTGDEQVDQIAPHIFYWPDGGCVHHLPPDPNEREAGGGRANMVKRI